MDFLYGPEMSTKSRSPAMVALVVDTLETLVALALAIAQPSQEHSFPVGLITWTDCIVARRACSLICPYLACASLMGLQETRIFGFADFQITWYPGTHSTVLYRAAARAPRFLFSWTRVRWVFSKRGRVKPTTLWYSLLRTWCYQYRLTSVHRCQKNTIRKLSVVR